MSAVASREESVSSFGNAPAYPGQPHNGQGYPCGEMSDGLTKRELIAAMLLQGIVSNAHIMAAGKTHDGTPLNETRFAEQAVYMADTLLKELAK